MNNIRELPLMTTNATDWPQVLQLPFPAGTLTPTGRQAEPAPGTHLVRVDLALLTLEAHLAIVEADGETIEVFLQLQQLKELRSVLHAADQELSKLKHDRDNVRTAAAAFIATAGGLESARQVLDQVARAAP